MATIYVVGPRASGKSSVGRILAKELGYVFYDQDHVFHKGYGTISEFIAKHGWEKYNETMFEILTRLPSKNAVISGGGCIFMNNAGTGIETKKIAFCKKKGIIVALAPSRVSLLGARITFSRSARRNNTLMGNALPKESFWAYLKQYKLRAYVNKKHSDIMVYDNRSPANAARKVMAALRKRGV